MAKKQEQDDTKFEYNIKLGPKHKLNISIFKNQDDAIVLNLRKFYRNEDDEWRPDRQGLTMHLEQAKKLRKITKLLEEVQDDAPDADFGKKSKKRDDDDDRGKKSKNSKKRSAKDDEDDDE